MKVGDIVRVSVTDLNADGIGVGRIDGMILFVPYLLPGETASVTITKVEKNYAAGTVLERITTATERLEPSCEQFETCGGCRYMMLPLPEENRYKQRALQQYVRRFGLKAEVDETVSINEYHYRNKVVFHFFEDGSYGYYEEESHVPCSLRSCLLVPDDFITMANSAREVFPAGRLRYLYIRSSTQHEFTVVLSLRKNTVSQPETLCAEWEEILRKQQIFLTGIYLGHAEHPEDPDESFVSVRGSEYLTDFLGGLSLRSSFRSFRQVNFPMNEEMLRVLEQKIRDLSFRTVADLYCGTGTLGLYVAKHHPESVVSGIEINHSAVRDANENALRNGLTNISFRTGHADEIRAALSQTDLVIVDPPRFGCSDRLLRDLMSHTPPYILYISCNPNSLCKNLKVLSESYTIGPLTPLNLFPKTKHVETVVLMSRVDK